MNTVIIIAIIVIAALAALLIYAATRPDTLIVQRTTSIKASPASIFALVNDFHQWASGHRTKTKIQK